MEELDFGFGIVVVVDRFEYVLKLYEEYGLRNLSLVRYLKSDGWPESMAIRYAIAAHQFHA